MKAAALLTVLFASCVASRSLSTPFEPVGEYGGYWDKTVGPKAYRVGAAVNVFSEEVDAMRYFHARASLLCRTEHHARCYTFDFSVTSDRGTVVEGLIQCNDSEGIEVGAWAKPKAPLMHAASWLDWMRKGGTGMCASAPEAGAEI